MHELLDVALTWIGPVGRPALVVVVMVWAYCSGLTELAEEEGKRITQNFFNPMILLKVVMWAVFWGYAAPQALFYVSARFMKPFSGKAIFVGGFTVYFVWWFWTMWQTFTPFRRILRKQNR
ncbi:MAG: hypothetical protein H6728_08325 [Myxococcales bacterium]|nr:hypothetical protein [Myxococcales bacterium]MCB9643065.1 hypothetical protein [Myxococcales bacterium]